MRPDKLTVHELFHRERRYLVPLYQRPYVWKRAEQWEPLWEDIEAKASHFAGGLKPSPHFLGAVVLAGIDPGTRHVAAAQVIDGQQRLTTLQVFLAAFRDNVRRLQGGAVEGEVAQALAALGNRLADLTEHRDVMGAREERFKVWPTNSDRKEFEAVMSAGSREALDAAYRPQFSGVRKKTRLPGPLLVEAYRYFDEAVRAHIEPDGEKSESATKEAVIALFDAIKHCLQLVVIDLEAGDDPQVIFETLNARGEPLLPSDLIRNLVFSTAGQKGENPDTLYRDLWQAFDDSQPDGRPGFWKQKIKQGREFRPMLDLFFQHFLVSSLAREVSLGHLYDEFRGWWAGASSSSVRTTLEWLRKFSDAYRAFHDPASLKASDPRLALFLHRLKVLDTGTVYPFLLFLTVDLGENMTRPERDTILSDLESFLVRRWLCSVTTKNYNRLFPALIADLRKAGTVDHTSIRGRLASGSGDTRWPDDTEFEARWLRDPAYERVDSAGIAMVLEAIHLTMLGKKQEGVSITSPLTVEHVMPQSWREHWAAPKPPPEGASDDETLEERRNRLIHTFGNLTLLTASLNSSGDVSNSAWDSKRPAITQQSLLMLNVYFQEVPEWDEAAIVKRGRALFDSAKAIWRHQKAAT